MLRLEIPLPLPVNGNSVQCKGYSAPAAPIPGTKAAGPRRLLFQVFTPLTKRRPSSTTPDTVRKLDVAPEVVNHGRDIPAAHSPAARRIHRRLHVKSSQPTLFATTISFILSASYRAPINLCVDMRKNLPRY